MQLFAAFDTRSGQVSGLTFRRKRQVETLHLLNYLDATLSASITTIHLLADNVSVHHGKLVQRSWMNQVEQWFSIPQRKRRRHSNFADLAALTAAIERFISAWQAVAHPFRWPPHSFDEVLTKAGRPSRCYHRGRRPPNG